MTRLQELLDQGIIDEVYNQLKTGKEAEVWLVSHKGEAVAAKLYKAREFRSFKNDAGYLEGRTVRNSRTQRAMDKGSKFGREASEEAWKSAEADALFSLHAAGVRVPKPVLFFDGVLLMEAIGDAEGRVAPRLIDAGITAEQAGPLYLQVRADVIKMLALDLIHGDLSPFNILLATNGPVIIDFPQVVTAAKNSRSEQFFRRDLGNMLTFFSAIDPSLSRHAGDPDEIWREYVRRDLSPSFVPSGRGQNRGGPPGRFNSNGDRRGPPPNDRGANGGGRPNGGRFSEGSPNEGGRRNEGAASGGRFSGGAGANDRGRNRGGRPNGAGRPNDGAANGGRFNDGAARANESALSGGEQPNASAVRANDRGPNGGGRPNNGAARANDRGPNGGGRPNNGNGGRFNDGAARANEGPNTGAARANERGPNGGGRPNNGNGGRFNDGAASGAPNGSGRPNNGGRQGQNQGRGTQRGNQRPGPQVAFKSTPGASTASPGGQPAPKRQPHPHGNSGRNHGS